MKISLATNFDDKNTTMDAIKKAYQTPMEQEVIAQVPFTSKKKWSGISFQNQTIPVTYQKRLHHELKIIHDMGFDDYFLMSAAVIV